MWYDDGNDYEFQLGHVLSDMEIAAYFSRSLLLTEC